jgi:hypothetical protein
MGRAAELPQLAPRLLTAEQAAGYLGSISVAAFKRLRLGEVPIGPSIRYDRHVLDAHLDRIAGMAPQSPPAGLMADNDDPEAAFDRSAPDLENAPRGS